MTSQTAPEGHIRLDEGGRIDVRHDHGGAFVTLATTQGATMASIRVWLTPAEMRQVSEALRPQPAVDYSAAADRIVGTFPT